VTLKELLSNVWGFGIRPPLRIGLLHFALGIFSLLVAGYDYLKTKKFDYRITIAILLITSFSLLFANSNYFWELPLYKQIDFPWRMLGIVMFLSALISGVLVRGKYKKAIVVLIILGTMILNLKFIKTGERIYQSDDYYSTNDATTTSANELMPIWVKQDPATRQEKKTKLIGIGHVQVKQDFGDKLILTTEISDISVAAIQVNTVYFPGWTSYLDSEKISTKPSEQGLINITSIPAGWHKVELKYERTPVRWAADIITILSLFVLVITTTYRYIIVKRKDILYA